MTHHLVSQEHEHLLSNNHNHQHAHKAPEDPSAFCLFWKAMRRRSLDGMASSSRCFGGGGRRDSSPSVAPPSPASPPRLPPPPLARSLVSPLPPPPSPPWLQKRGGKPSWTLLGPRCFPTYSWPHGLKHPAAKDHGDVSSGEFASSVSACLPPPYAAAASPLPLPDYSTGGPAPRRAHGLFGRFFCLGAAQHNHRGARRRGPRPRRGIQVSFSAPSPVLSAGRVEGKLADFCPVVASGGDSERRNAVDSALFKQWLRNLQSEKGGGCDEEIGLFLYRGRVDEDTIRSLEGKETGLRDHGELINLRVVPYGQLWRSTADAKALCAIALYEMAKREGLLPSYPPTANL
ncbi:hypothetical protein HU200_015064 [Digitaria exilis]|uniref:Uncharacterized protein n=1 Tax=Digitaria exilis TaxID=1010633 RepID=A0A835F9W1_9POAL|nr:hypothetical protein HU200_015064 [Digitaria exilis]